MSTFTYEHLDAAQVAAVQEAAIPPADPVLDYASLLPAWESDHAAHVALLAAAQQSGDQEEIDRHTRDIATLEEAILKGRQTLGSA